MQGAIVFSKGCKVTHKARGQAAAEVLRFFRSPIFAALVLGLLVSFFSRAIVLPLLVFLASFWYSNSELWHKVLVLEAAMPSAILSAVSSKRYGCDAGLASLIIFVTVILSAFTVLGLLSLL